MLRACRVYRNDHDISNMDRSSISTAGPVLDNDRPTGTLIGQHRDRPTDWMENPICSLLPYVANMVVDE